MVEKGLGRKGDGDGRKGVGGGREGVEVVRLALGDGGLWMDGWMMQGWQGFDGHILSLPAVQCTSSGEGGVGEAMCSRTVLNGEWGWSGSAAESRMVA